jgi:hypothetical protein
MLVVIAVVATGAGLHVAAYFIEHKARISLLATLLSVAVPVGVLGILYTGYTSRVFLALVLLIAALPAPSAAAQVADLRNLSVVRFDFDNDVFLGKDNEPIPHQPARRCCLVRGHLTILLARSNYPPCKCPHLPPQWQFVTRSKKRC